MATRYSFPCIYLPIYLYISIYIYIDISPVHIYIYIYISHVYLFIFLVLHKKLLSIHWDKIIREKLEDRNRPRGDAGVGVSIQGS